MPLRLHLVVATATASPVAMLAMLVLRSAERLQLRPMAVRRNDYVVGWRRPLLPHDMCARARRRLSSHSSRRRPAQGQGPACINGTSTFYGPSLSFVWMRTRCIMSRMCATDVCSGVFLGLRWVRLFVCTVCIAFNICTSGIQFRNCNGTNVCVLRISEMQVKNKILNFDLFYIRYEHTREKHISIYARFQVHVDDVIQKDSRPS